jgi:hypothetical protein
MLFERVLPINLSRGSCMCQAFFPHNKLMRQVSSFCILQLRELYISEIERLRCKWKAWGRAQALWVLILCPFHCVISSGCSLFVPGSASFYTQGKFLGDSFLLTSQFSFVLRKKDHCFSVWFSLSASKSQGESGFSYEKCRFLGPTQTYWFLEFRKLAF